MATNHFTPNYNYHQSNNNAWRHYPHTIPNRTRNGPYDIIEKDVDGQKVLYYVPSSYGSDYDLSQLDERPSYREQPKYYPPVVSKHRYYQSSADDDDDEYILVSRRETYVPPKRSQVTKRIYYEPEPTTETIEYIYEEDYRPKHKEVVEYVVRDRAPRKRYVEEIPFVRHSTFVENLPPITRSPRPSPTKRPLKPLQLNENLSARRSKMKQRTPRISPIHPTPRNIVSRNKNQKKHISLSDIVTENRARRGSRIPRPRREVDVEELHDLPTYNRNFVKSGFFVHK